MLRKSIVVLMILALLGFSACTVQPEVAQEPSQDDETIKLGLSVPLSGDIANIGKNALAGAALAVADANANGGVDGKMIELIVEDDECSAASVAVFQKLLNVDDVVGIVGPVCSSAAGAGVPLAQQNEIPSVMIAASNPTLTSIGDFVFRVYPSDAFAGKEAARVVFETLEVDEVGIIFAQEEYGVALAEVFKEAYEAMGGQVLYEGGIDRDQADLRTELSKLDEAGVDTVFLAAWPTNVIAFDRQAQEMDLDITIVGGDTYETAELLTSGFAEGAYYVIPKVLFADEFAARVNAQEEFADLEVSLFASLGYDAAAVMIDAIDRADSMDGPAIREALFQTSYNGVSNDLIEFTAIGELTEPLYDLKQITDGEGVVIN